MDYPLMGNCIRAARKAKHWTQEQLAEQAGISTAFVGHIERATRIPSIDTLARLCVALDTSADFCLQIKRKKLGADQSSE